MPSACAAGSTQHAHTASKRIFRPVRTSGIDAARARNVKRALEAGCRFATEPAGCLAVGHGGWTGGRRGAAAAHARRGPSAGARRADAHPLCERSVLAHFRAPARQAGVLQPGCTLSAVKRTPKRAPGGCWPARASSSVTSAPCLRAIFCTIDSPRPEPSASLPSTR